MAKLTAEQKAANKLAASARSKAFNARRSAYFKALEHADAQVEASQLGAALREAFEAEAAAREQAMAERDALLKRLRALQDEIAAHTLAAEARLAPLAAARNKAATLRNAARAAKQKEVDEAFSDVHASASAAAWKPLEDFVTKD